MHSLKWKKLSSACVAKLLYILHNLALFELPKSPEKYATAQTYKVSSTKANIAAHFSEPVLRGPSSAIALTDHESAVLSKSEDVTCDSSKEISFHDSTEISSEKSVVE